MAPGLVSPAGTPGDDTFEFAPGATPATWIVTLNGASQTVAAADTFQAWPEMARLYGPRFYNRVKSLDYIHGYAYLAMGFEQVDADSSNSSDQLSIDPAGVDFLLLINGEEW